MKSLFTTISFVFLLVAGYSQQVLHFRTVSHLSGLDSIPAISNDLVTVNFEFSTIKICCDNTEVYKISDFKKESVGEELNYTFECMDSHGFNCNISVRPSVANISLYFLCISYPDKLLSYYCNLEP